MSTVVSTVVSAVSTVVPARVSASIAHFISMEVSGGPAMTCVSPVAPIRHFAVIAVMRVEMIIYVAMKIARAVEPPASADEGAVIKPFRAVVAIRSTGIRSVVEVTVGAYWGRSDVDAYLCFCFGSSCREANCSNSRYCKIFKSVHKFSSIGDLLLEEDLRERVVLSLIVPGGDSQNYQELEDINALYITNHFPMQNVEKIRFKMSSGVVSPVRPSSWRSAPYRSIRSISWGVCRSTALFAADSASSAAVTA